MPAAELPTFAAFYTAVHGYPPFPWQAALADRLLAGERWPNAVDVPTGLGKTSLLDIAVYALAAGALDARRRVFFVVDRRLVVDEASDHADKIATALASPPPDEPGRARVLQAVAARLRAPEDDPQSVVEVTKMRGGTTWAQQWVERPDRCALVVGTVDQIGSRFFLRGYGLSDRRRPIDAALVGTDSLILVDEAHLAQAMLTSVEAATADQPDERLSRPRWVQMSATVHDPQDAGHRVHSITEADEEHRIARQRLDSPKRLFLVEPALTKKNAPQVMADHLATWAQTLAQSCAAGPVVLVVCNTVARARAVFDLLKDRGVDEEQRVLLMGRSRPVDRELLMARFYRRIQVGHPRDGSEPLFVVATQTVEVGANIDADALVTESASMSALIQRLGRLARAPEDREDSEEWEARAVVVHDASVGEDDPVYGASRQATWTFLSKPTPPLKAGKKQAGRLEDLGEGRPASPAALRKLLKETPPEVRRGLQEPAPAPPVLHEGVLRIWEQTCPVPVTDVPVAPFLHGIDTRTPDVTLIWRADIDPATCLDPHTQDVAEAVATRLRAVAPSSEEQLQISLAALRRWRGRRFDEASQVADVEGGSADTFDQVGGDEYVLRYRGPGELARITIDQVRPGDVIIVPASFGGCDAYGWAPHSTEPVTDVADLASRRQRPVVRVHPRLASLGACPDTPAGRELAAALRELCAPADEADAEDLPAAREYLPLLQRIQHLADACDPAHPLLRNLAILAQAGKALKVTFAELTPPEEPATQHSEPENKYPTVLPVLGVDFRMRSSDADEASTSHAPTPITLAAHQDEVARQAAVFARNIGLDQALVHAAYLAGLWHDEGKRDPRFQALLYGLSLGQVPAEQALAKSLTAPTDARARHQALRQSGYPARARHEGLSARIADHHLDHPQHQGVDRDLVLHLIASHHGHSRPLLPPVADPDPQQVLLADGQSVSTAGLLDWEAPARFGRLNARLGRWKLALVEAVVRMADIWCSSGQPVTTTTYTPPTPSAAPEPAPEAVEYTVALPALDGRDALGFLAALGTLRLLDQHHPGRVRLSFHEVTATAQIISTLPDLDAITTTLGHVAAAVPDGGVLPGVGQAWPPQTGVGKDPLRVPRHDFATALEQAFVTGGEQAPVWLRAVVTDLAADHEGRVGMTPFMAPAGQQKAATFFSKPFELVRKDPNTIGQALSAWKRVKKYTGESLDHRAIHTAAYHGTGASTPWGVPGATWLATHALPLLTLSGDGRRLRSTLWHRTRQGHLMAWPVWRHPLEAEAVSVLLNHPATAPEPPLGGEGAQVPWVRREPLSPLGVLTMAAAQRHPIPGVTSNGVLAPTGIHVR